MQLLVGIFMHIMGDDGFAERSMRPICDMAIRRSRPPNASPNTTGGPKPRRQLRRGAACKWWRRRLVGKDD